MKNSIKPAKPRKSKVVVSRPLDNGVVAFKDGVSISVFGKVTIDSEKLEEWSTPFKVKRVKLNDEWTLSQVFINNDTTYKLYLEKPHGIKALTMDLVVKYNLEKYFEIKH